MYYSTVNTKYQIARYYRLVTANSQVKGRCITYAQRSSGALPLEQCTLPIGKQVTFKIKYLECKT